MDEQDKSKCPKIKIVSDWSKVFHQDVVAIGLFKEENRSKVLEGIEFLKLKVLSGRTKEENKEFVLVEVVGKTPFELIDIINEELREKRKLKVLVGVCLRPNC